MIKSPPPKSTDGLNVEHGVKFHYDYFFTPFFNILHEHYKPKFRWFKEDIPSVDKIVNIGIGEAGAETFALMWSLGASEAVGFDICRSRIKNANQKLDAAIGFVKEVVPHTLESCSEEYEKLFNAWYENDVAREIRDCELPIFKHGDVVSGLDWKENHFDLAYSRYLLDKVDEQKRLDAISEMIRVTRPGGHVIIVSPKRSIPDNLSNLEADLIRTVTEDGLGPLEEPKDLLRGYLFKKK